MQERKNKEGNFIATVDNNHNIILKFHNNLPIMFPMLPEDKLCFGGKMCFGPYFQ